MQIPILIDHLGIVPGHPLQGCKHRFFDLGSIVALLQGVLDLATPILIGNGILLGSFLKQWKTKVPILGPSKFLTRPGMLPSHGTIPSAAPLNRGCLGQAPGGFRLLARAQSWHPMHLWHHPLLLQHPPRWSQTVHVLDSLVGRPTNGALCKGGFIEVRFLKLLLHEESISPSGHALPLG